MMTVIFMMMAPQMAQEEMTTLGEKMGADMEEELKFLPVNSNLGDHITREAFIKWVNDGYIIDYDGHGRLATNQMVSNIIIYPSRITTSNFSWPGWATHVVWYNR
jgi:hypothetical protein